MFSFQIINQSILTRAINHTFYLVSINYKTFLCLPFTSKSKTEAGIKRHFHCCSWFVCHRKVYRGHPPESVRDFVMDKIHHKFTSLLPDILIIPRKCTFILWQFTLNVIVMIIHIIVFHQGNMNFARLYYFCFITSHSCCIEYLYIDKSSQFQRNHKCNSNIKRIVHSPIADFV